MGSGIWSSATYETTASAAKAAGKSAFNYTDSTLRSVPHSSWTAHSDLDPKGVEFRESRDSDEHPTSVGIAVLFDVTGSMHNVPRVMQTKLPELFGLLLRKGYVEHPQIMFGAIGDATCDRVPLQVGQFESDNRLDENLGNIVLERGGGGSMQESYELAMYFMLNHTATDCWEKRGHRAYLFIIGDEKAYDKVSASQVRSVIGDEVSETPTTAALVRELQEKYDVYYLHPAGGSYRNTDEVSNFWRDLLGQNYITLDDDEAVCETIALTIGLGEGTVELEDGIEDLKEIGSAHAESVGRALATVGARGAVTESEGPTDLDAVSDGGAKRL